MGNWGNCSECNSSITIPVGETGDNGLSVSGIVTVSATGTTTLTEAQTGSTVILSSAAGATVRLPTAPPLGTYFDFVVATALTSNTYVVDAMGGDLLDGYMFGMKASTAPEIFLANSAASTHITFNGSTTGGLEGTSFRALYTNETTNMWTVTGQFYGSAVLATCFS